LQSVKDLQAKIKKKDSEAFGQVAAMQAIIYNIESQQANHIYTFQTQALEACELTEMWADKARIALRQRKALMEIVKRALIWRARSAIKRRVMNQCHGRCAKTSLLINKMPEIQASSANAKRGACHSRVGWSHKQFNKNLNAS
jgi:hypothetical protein